MTGAEVDLFRKLIAIDSTSALCNLPIANELASRALNAATVDLLDAHEPGKVNLMIRYGPEPDESGRGLILSGHMDAVPAKEAGWTSDPFVLTDAGDRYVGRGAADMKGFLAAALIAAESSEKLIAPLVLLFTCDEEVGTLGAHHFARSWKKPLPKRCIIGEPTSFRPVRAHKGHLKIRLTTTGKSAHSGYPHLGENAIEKMPPVLDALIRLRRELELERGEHAPLFPDAAYVPLNIATVRGGSAINIVPDHCEIEIGIRLMPGMTDDVMVDRVRRVAGDASVEVISSSPPMFLDAKSAIYDAALPHSNREGAESVSFASDAGWLQTMGIECLLFGPGAIEVAHKPNEFIPKEEFHRAVPVLRTMIERFCA